VVKGTLGDFGQAQGRTKTFIDNAAVCFVCHKKFSAKRCQHVSKKQLLCRDAHHAPEGALEACEIKDMWTDMNPADLGTKALGPKQFSSHAHTWMHDDEQDMAENKAERKKLCDAVETCRRARHAQRRAKSSAGRVAAPAAKVAAVGKDTVKEAATKIKKMADEFEKIVNEASEVCVDNNGGKMQLNFKTKKKIREFKNWMRQLTRDKET